ncbi:MAG: hypothetical protein RBS57_02840 [Desulforhabdus sp.]|jgi:hypothetical protein|nr:hypothetical protein [Desulforhabdus sp.]
MNQIALRLQREAERIASRHSLPAFYVQFKAPLALARKIFFAHPLVTLLREMIEPVLNEDLGHGIHHSTRVSIDSAALVYVELESNPMEPSQLERLMILGLFSGLLHDICRGQESHAEAGAVEAVQYLEELSLGQEEIDCICQAIRNHEAFVKPKVCSRPSFQLLSDCLYDADKFRWGPDTFTHTLWRMMNHQEITPQELIDRFPWGMTGMLRIVDTFRTATGRQFGPEIIETGVEIGREIYRYLVQNFGEL